MNVPLKTLICAMELVGSAQAQCLAPSLDPAFERIVNQSAKSQKDAFLQTLKASNNYRQFLDSVFYYGDRLRPGLRLLATGRRGNGYWIEFASLIGEPEDLRAVKGKPPRSDLPLSYRWAYQVACSLLDASSDQDWSFLRKCALRQIDDPWAVTGAIQTLRLIASPRAREMLVS